MDHWLILNPYFQGVISNAIYSAIVVLISYLFSLLFNWKVEIIANFNKDESVYNIKLVNGKNALLTGVQLSDAYDYSIKPLNTRLTRKGNPYQLIAHGDKFAAVIYYKRRRLALRSKRLYVGDQAKAIFMEQFANKSKKPLWRKIKPEKTSTKKLANKIRQIIDQSESSSVLIKVFMREKPSFLIKSESPESAFHATMLSLGEDTNNSFIVNLRGFFSKRPQKSSEGQADVYDIEATINELKSVESYLRSKQAVLDLNRFKTPKTPKAYLQAVQFRTPKRDYRNPAASPLDDKLYFKLLRTLDRTNIQLVGSVFPYSLYLSKEGLSFDSKGLLFNIDGSTEKAYVGFNGLVVWGDTSNPNYTKVTQKAVIGLIRELVIWDSISKRKKHLRNRHSI